MPDALTVIPPRRAAECDGAAHRDLRAGRIPAGANSASRIAAMLAAARGWRHYRRTEGGSYYGESVRQLPSPFARLQRDA